MNETLSVMPDIDVRPGMPYDKLFIYYMEGRLNGAEQPLGADFIGNWQEDGFSFLFFSKPHDAAVAGLVTAQPHLTLIDKYHMTYEQWQGGKITPFSAGRFFIAPPWEQQVAPDESIRIVLDPGVVFGTGTHPTTHDCLEALERVFQKAPIHSTVDLGTGTGVLALAAAKLGSKRSLAVDFNCLAAKTAGKNVRLNLLDKRILVIQGRAEDWIHHPADLVIANIHHEVMMNLIDSKGFYNKKWFILSGLLRSQAREVADLLAGQGVTVLKKWEQGGIWHTFLGKVH
jgi:ribosomal protein L11 methyltransferase